jgi:hypothetical protein
MYASCSICSARELRTCFQSEEMGMVCWCSSSSSCSKTRAARKDVGQQGQARHSGKVIFFSCIFVLSTFCAYISSLGNSETVQHNFVPSTSFSYSLRKKKLLINQYSKLVSAIHVAYHQHSTSENDEAGFVGSLSMNYIQNRRANSIYEALRLKLNKCRAVVK